MHPKDEPEEDDPLAYLEKLDRFFDGEEQTTLYFELEKKGEAPNLSDDLSDADVTRELTNLIWALYDQHVVIEFTDHLSDRDLYHALRDYCDEPNVSFAGFKNAWTHWSPIGSWTEEDTQIWLRYYADEKGRQDHAEEWPNDPMPPSELPPYPRPWIPKPVYVDENGEEFVQGGPDDPL